MMRSYNFIALIVLVGGLMSIASSAEDSVSTTGSYTHTESHMPKLFDFGRFKQIFEKSYGSIVEELVRQKLFLARAFRAFMSRIKYEHDLSSYYLSVNVLSDWTREELKSTLNPRNSQLPAQPIPEPEPLASEDDIERELADLQKHVGGVELEEIAEEMAPVACRQRRDTNSGPCGAHIESVTDEGERLHDDSYFEEISRDENRGFNLAQGVASMASIFKSHLRRHKKPKVITEYIVDHRKSGCLERPRHQGHCGCCYAMAMTALTEFLYCKATGNLTRFSEQYLIDCGTRQSKRWLRGCSGGYGQESAKFVAEYGIELASTYPFVKRGNKCPYAPETEPRKMGHIRPNFRPISVYNETSLLEKKLQFTPLVLSLTCGNSDFWEYGGGVHNLRGCALDPADHEVLLIGYGRENGKDFWLIQNSYGESYGEGGYYKLDKKSGCILDPAFAFRTDSHLGMLPEINSENDPEIMIQAGKKLKRRNFFHFW